MTTHNYKLPPQDLEAEKFLLGSILIDPDSIFKVADVVTEESFYQPEHQLLFKSMRQLYENNQPIDVVTLSAQLKKNGEL